MYSGKPIKLSTILFFATSFVFAANNFTVTGGNVVSNYWNDSNTGGTANITAQADPVNYVGTYISVDGGAYQAITGGDGSIGVGGSRTFSLTAANIEAADAPLSDGETFHIYAVFSNFGSPVDTIALTSTALTVDQSPPAEAAVGTVVAVGGSVVTAKWNSSNTALQADVPVANDGTLLLGGTIQLLGKIGSNPYANLGNAENIDAINVTEQIQVSAADVEALLGFDEDRSIYIKAKITDAAGNESIGDESGSVIGIDQTAPSITSITSSPISTTLGEGDNVTLTVTFSENVTLSSGTLDMELETGSSDAVVSVTAASLDHASTASFTYSVGANEVSDDLDVKQFTLSGANSLKDAAGNDAVLTVPGSSNLADNSNIEVDGVSPTIVSVTSTTPNGQYALGEDINVTVTFSEAVTLSSGQSLQVTMETGTTDRIVSISSISSSTTATGTYTVQSDDASSLLVAQSPLTLTGGTLQDAAGNDLSLSFTTNIDNASTIEVDGGIPDAVNLAGGSGTVVASGGTVKADYWNSDNTNLDITIPIADDASLLNGSVQIQGYWGVVGGAQNLGSASSIGATGVDKLIQIPAATLEAFGGFAEGAVLKIVALVTDKAGNQSTLGTKSDNEITIDQTAPSISNISSTTANGYVIPGDGVNVTLTFTEAVTLAGGTLDVEFETGSSDETASIATISSSTTASGTYTVQINDVSSDLNVNRVFLSSGTLLDVAGNDASMTLPSGQNLADNKGIIVDGIIPTVTSVTSSSPNGDYSVGETVDITVAFSEEVTLTGGSLLVTIETGDPDRTVTIASISGSDEATGTYTVQTGDVSSDLDANSPLTLSAGSLRDAAGNDVDLSFTSSIATGSAIVVDGEVPDVVNLAGGLGTVVATGGTVVADYWNSSNNFLEVVVPIAADPSLIDGTVQVKGYWGVVGGAQDLGDPATINATGVNKTIQIPAATLESFPGFDEGEILKIVAVVSDKAGNESTVGTESDDEITIDQTVPTVAGISSTSADEYKIPGASVNITVTFSEAVTLTGGNLEVELETGATDETVTITTINSSLTGSENYVVQTDDESDDLTVNSLSLSAGSLRDAAGNDATLTISAGLNLADNNDIIVDGVIPTITGISSDTNDDSPLSIGDEVNVIVTFSEEVTLSGGGNLQVTLETGATDRIVSISSISSSATASGTYTVQSGDESSDLSANSPVVLTAGTLQDVAGNDVVLTFTGNIDDNSDLIIDGNVPDAVDLSGGAGTVVASGGTVVTDYWNSTNTALNITVPIAADASLLNGSLQIKGYWGVVGGAQNLGATSTISATGTDKTVQISAATLESFAGYAENEVLKIIAIVTDAAGNESSVGTESDNEITIDKTAPMISSVTSNTNGYVIPGNTVDVLLTFSEAVTLTGGDLLITLETGSTDEVVTISTISSATTATDDYSVQIGDESDDLNANSVALSAGSLRDAAGNDAVLSLPADENLADNNAIIVDGVIPTIESVTSTTGEVYYAQGDDVPFTITFSEAVTLAGGGSLQIEMETGATDRTVSITSINNSLTATGTYTVQDNDVSSDLNVNVPLVLVGATLKDAAGNDVDLTTIPVNISAGSDAIIDGSIPDAVNMAGGLGTVISTGGTVVSDYWNGTNTALSVSVPIAADASLLDGQVQLQGYWGVVGGAQNLGDAVTITATGTDQVISIPAATLEAFAGYAEGSVLKIIALVSDKAGNESSVGTESDDEITIDKTVPTISSITSTTADGYAIPADDVNVTVNFSEAVTLTGGNLEIQLETGSSDETVSVSTISSSLTAVGIYTVAEDHESSDLSVQSISLSAGSLRDAAGNDATLTLPVGENLNDNSNIVVDGVIPTVTSVTSTSDDSDQYAKDGVISLTVWFSEAVTLSNLETLDLDIDASGTDVQISSFSASTSATGSYTVLEDDASTDLTVNAMSISGGTLTDAAGNSVDLTDISGITNLDDAFDFVIDGILPPDFNMISAVTTSGNSVTGYWNNLNDGLNVTVAIPNDLSLQNGTLQIQGRVAANSFVSLGAASTILATNTNKTILVDDTDIEGMTGFADGETFTITAEITDVSGNTTAADVLTNIEIDIDRVAPTITEITSTTNDGFYSVGESVNVTVTLSEAVTLQSGEMSVTLNTAVEHILTDNEITTEQVLPFTLSIIEGLTANPLTVTAVSATSNQLLDIAGNEVDFTLPATENLADNSNIIIDGEYPSITNISAVVVTDTLGLGETIDVEVEFNEALTLAGGTLDVVFETGDTDQTVSIAAFASSTTATASYTVAVGENSTDLNVTSVSLSGGTLQDIAGNDLSMTLPSGTNLSDNNDILVDGIVPEAFTTGNILTVGAPVVTGYWNLSNTGVEVILPVTGSDLSLDGGTAHLEARLNANDFAAVGNSSSVGTNPVSLSLSRAELESVAGYGAGGTIQIRGVLTDIAGNATTGATSVIELIMDQTAPTAPTTGTLTVVGGNLYPDYWNDTNTSLVVSIPLDADNTLIDGSIQLESDLNSAGNFAVIGDDSTISSISANHDITLSAADMTTYGVGDGDIMTFRAVVTDVAGNETTGTIGLNTLTVDYTFPADFTVGTVLAVDNSVVPGYFNGTNTGAEVTIPIADDATLIGGQIQLRATVDAFAAEDILAPYDIASVDDVTLSVDRAVLEALTFYAEDRVISFDAIITDVAGNATTGTVSVDELIVDQTAPQTFAIDTIIPDGGTIRAGYWNATNTDVEITVPIDGTDLSIIGGGTLTASADIIGDGNFETFTVDETIVAATGTLSLLVPAAELEALEGGTAFLDGQDIEFRAIITDEAGNSTTSATSAQLLEIDRSAPDAPDIVAFTIKGENIVPLIWNATSDSLLLTIPVDIVADPTLVDGFFQVQMSVGSTFSENSYYNVLPDSFAIPTADDTIRIAAADIEALPDYADLNLYTRILIQDRAGNETTGATASDVVLIDTEGPANFVCGPLTATGGIIVNNAYNNTNTGISLEIPIANDPSLLNGSVILRAATRNLNVIPPDLIIPDYIDTVSISEINTTLEMTLDHAALVALGGFISNYSLFASADLLDIAGNQVEGTQSPNELTIDFDGPLPPVVTDTTTVGGNVVEGYWNASNTGINLTILTPVEVDTSLLGGYFQIEGRIGNDGVGTLVDSLPIVSRNITEIVASIDSVDLEALSLITEGQPIDLRIRIFDGRGNDTLGAWMEDILIMDQLAPSPSSFNADATTTDAYITFDDTLKADWQDFTDDVSGVAYYDYSIGHAEGTDDFLPWDTLLTTTVDTLMAYTHAAEYFLNVRAMDVAGNLSEILSSPVITADLELPVTTSDMERYYFIEDWPGTLTGTFSDDLSGVDSIWLGLKRASDEYYWTGTNWIATDTLLGLTPNETVWNYPLLSDSLTNREDYIISLLGRDVAGNLQSMLSDPITATLDTFQFVMNMPPVFVDGLSYADSSDEDFPYSRIYLAEDPDVGSISGDTLYYSLSDDTPAGVHIDSLSGLLTWLPVDSAVGAHAFTLYVEDYYGERDTLGIDFGVIEVNDAPEPVTLLLPADSTQLLPADSLLLTFKWTTAFDIEDNPVTYRISMQGTGYDTTLIAPDTSITVDVSVMDFPSSTIEWFVRALDQADTSAIADTFHVTTSSAFASLNTDSVAVNIGRMTNIDTSFTMSNLGLTDLRWSLLNAPVWINMDTESGIIEYDTSAVIAFNINPLAFTVGGYGGQFQILTNDPLQDTITVKVSMEIFDVPTPVIAFYKNRAYPAYYEMMIVDSLGMIDSLVVSHAGLEVELTTVDTFSYVALVEVSEEGLNTFEVYASNWVGDTTITANVTVSLIKRGAGWLARSPDEQFEIKGGSNSVTKTSRIAVLDSMLSANDDARYKVLTDGIVLAEPVLVSMPAVTTDQAVYMRDGSGEYFELASISDGERVSAWSATLGAFKLGPRTIIVPDKSRLSQNYPNPFNPSTTIDFDIGFLDGLNQEVGFSIYNIRGQEVRNLMQTHMQPGSYSVMWNGLDDQGKQVSSGIYFARLMTGKGYAKTVKMLVLR